MLVLTTMFINVSNNLPKTSYVKMIDVWMIFTMTFPLFEVALHTYKESLKKSLSQSGIRLPPTPPKVSQASVIPSRGESILMMESLKSMYVMAWTLLFPTSPHSSEHL